MKPVFLDTGYVIPLEAADDQYHEEAIKHWRDLLRNVPTLVTTTYVINEIATFFNSRNRHDKAVEIINRLKHSSSVKIVHVSEKLFDASWEYFKKHSDEVIAKLFRSWFDRLTTNGISICYTVHPEPVEG